MKQFFIALAATVLSASLEGLVERRARLHKNLSSAVRVFILDHYRNRCGLEQPESGDSPG